MGRNTGGGHCPWQAGSGIGALHMPVTVLKLGAAGTKVKTAKSLNSSRRRSSGQATSRYPVLLGRLVKGRSGLAAAV